MLTKKKPQARRRSRAEEPPFVLSSKEDVGAETPRLNAISLSSSGVVKVLQTDLGATDPQGLRARSRYYVGNFDSLLQQILLLSRR